MGAWNEEQKEIIDTAAATQGGAMPRCAAVVFAILLKDATVLQLVDGMGGNVDAVSKQLSQSTLLCARLLGEAIGVEPREIIRLARVLAAKERRGG